jgi:hypothetical protein
MTSITAILLGAALLYFLSFIIWITACNYTDLPDKNLSGWQISRLVPYRHFTILKTIVAILTLATYFFGDYQERDGNADWLGVSLILYFIFGAVCIFDSIKALRTYINDTYPDS